MTSGQRQGSLSPAAGAQPISESRPVSNSCLYAHSINLWIPVLWTSALAVCSMASPNAALPLAHLSASNHEMLR